MVKAFSKQIIHEIRRLVLSGVSKYETANILSISNSSVYKHTRDLPSKKTGNPGIRGKTLDVLKQLITKGYVFSTKDTSDNLHTIKKHFPNIKRTQINGKSLYYFEDKNKQALEAYN